MELRMVLPRVALAPKPRRLVPGKPLYTRDHRHQIHAHKPWPRACFLLERCEVELAGRLVSDHGVRHSLFADERGERARIDTGQSDDATRLEPLIEVARRTVV